MIWFRSSSRRFAHYITAVLSGTLTPINAMHITPAVLQSCTCEVPPHTWPVPRRWRRLKEWPHIPAAVPDNPLYNAKHIQCAQWYAGRCTIHKNTLMSLKCKSNYDRLDTTTFASETPSVCVFILDCVLNRTSFTVYLLRSPIEIHLAGVERKSVRLGHGGRSGVMLMALR